MILPNAGYRYVYCVILLSAVCVCLCRDPCGVSLVVFSLVLSLGGDVDDFTSEGIFILECSIASDAVAVFLLTLFESVLSKSHIVVSYLQNTCLEVLSQVFCCQT